MLYTVLASTRSISLCPKLHVFCHFAHELLSPPAEICMLKTPRPDYLSKTGNTEKKHLWLNLLESMQTMIRHVKNSSYVPSILTVTAAKNVAALTAGRFLHAISNHVYTCSKCCHLSCLFEGTVFQDCKLDLHKLLLGFFYLLHFQQRCQRNRDASSAGCKLQDCITAVQKIQNAIQIRCRITCSMKQM